MCIIWKCSGGVCTYPEEAGVAFGKGQQECSSRPRDYVVPHAPARCMQLHGVSEAVGILAHGNHHCFQSGSFHCQ